MRPSISCNQEHVCFSGGRVVFFSTSLATASAVTPNYMLYVSTKGAVEQISRTLAKDLGARQITVNTVAPGPINTDMFRQGKTEQQIAFFASMHPPKRLGEPDEVANVVAFLAGPESSWVNGQTLRVNGVRAVLCFGRTSPLTDTQGFVV